MARAPRDGSIYLGASARGAAWADRECSVLVIGPSRSGKTSSLVVPNVLCAPGAVVTTSTKSDVLTQTAGSRHANGWCFLFDPSGSVATPPGVHRIGWSPVSTARDWGRSIEVADAMMRACRGTVSDSIAAGPEGHWTERAASLLAPLLHAAALSGEPMRTVLHWVDRHDGSQALTTLVERCGEDAVATDVLAGILSTEERERSGIWSTASGALGAYRTPAALVSTEGPYLDPDAFCTDANTLYICASRAHQQLLAPLVVGMVAQVKEAAYRRAATTPNTFPPVLLALDEVANIAPLPDLPSIVTEGPGQGLLTLACLQDLSQGRQRWGAPADSFLSIFGTTIVLPGIADLPTLEALSSLSGDRELVSRTVSTSEGALGPQATTSHATVLRRRLAVDDVARGRTGCALALDAQNRLGWIRLTPAHASRPFDDHARNMPVHLGLPEPAPSASRSTLLAERAVDLPARVR